MRKKDLTLFGISALLTLTSALFISGEWMLSGFLLGGTGRGYPFYWYRQASDGVVYINILVNCFWSFIGDVLFWFFVLLLVRILVRKIVSFREK